MLVTVAAPAYSHVPGRRQMSGYFRHRTWAQIQEIKGYGMNGALVGLRIDGEKKLLRLHGERSCEGVLTELLDYLRSIDDADLFAYARMLTPITTQCAAIPDAAARDALRPFFAGNGDFPKPPGTWAEVFAAYPDLDGWKARLPFQPAAVLGACGDVSWGFLLDLDAEELQIFGNRNARFHWREIACPQPATCTLPLAHVRELTAQDLAALRDLLHQHAYSDGIDPVLPLRDALSTPFPGPGAWQSRLQFVHGRVRLQLERGPLRARVRQVGEIRLDDPHCATLLRESLDPDVLNMTLAIYGSGACLGQIALVTNHLHQLPFACGNGGLPLLDLGLRPANELGLELGPAFFDALRTRLLACGMSVQGWRFLIKQDDAVLRFVLQFFPPSARILDSFSRFINLLASALQNTPLKLGRCQAALRGVERILDRTHGRPDATREDNARIFLRAIMQAALHPPDEANLPHDAQDVSDYVYAHPAILKGATWRSLCRRSDAWHRALLITADPDKDARWPALLPTRASGPFVAVELNSGFLLAEDGLEQRHCIGSYANACTTGATRVFSLRRDGKRVATLELQRGHDGAWRMVQVRGKANSIVRDPAVLQAADDVTQAYAQAARLSVQSAPTPRTDGCPGEYQPPAYLAPRPEHWTG